MAADEWVRFRLSIAEKEILLRYCEVTQRTQSDVMRELLRSLAYRPELSNQAARPRKARREPP